MRTSITVALFALAAATFATPARAQGFYWSLTYEPSVPVAGIRQATSNVSFAGGGLGARYLFSKYWSIGLSGHWNQFAQDYPFNTYVIMNGAFTGRAFRQVWTGTALAEVQIYLAPDAPINPYLAIGGGYTWLTNQIWISDLQFEDHGAGVTVCPEAGFLIAFDRDPFDPRQFAMQSIAIGVRYTLSAAKARDVDNTSFLGLTVGVMVY